MEFVNSDINNLITYYQISEFLLQVFNHTFFSGSARRAVYYGFKNPEYRQTDETATYIQRSKTKLHQKENSLFEVFSSISLNSLLFEQGIFKQSMSNGNHELNFLFFLMITPKLDFYFRMHSDYKLTNLYAVKHTKGLKICPDRGFNLSQ